MPGDREGPRAGVAPAAAVAFSAVIPVMDIALTAYRAGSPAVLWVAATTAVFLPGFLLLVWHAARGTRMRRGGWALGIIAAAAAWSLPLGGGWAPLMALGVAALLALRVPWSLLVVAALTVAQVAWSAVYDEDASAAVWTGFSLVWAIAAVFSVVWLVGVMGRLRVARAVLADNAVVLERTRTERELRQTLGSALSAIVTQGEQAAAQLRHDSDRTTATIEVLVDESRATLADARRIIGALSRTSVRSELDTARSLLAAAGMSTTVAASVADLDADDELARTALRSAVADLLADPRWRGASVAVSRHDGELTLTTAPGNTW